MGDNYIDYRKSGYSKKFYEVHWYEIIFHNGIGTIFWNRSWKNSKGKNLNEEFAKLLSEKKVAYSELKRDEGLSDCKSK